MRCRDNGIEQGVESVVTHLQGTCIDAAEVVDCDLLLSPAGGAR